MDDRRTDNELLQGFGPVYSGRARILVLGSMPGIRSLRAGEYYAHPRNAFWPIMAELFAIPVEWPYPRRTAALAECGIALWDVIGQCRRPGSLDQRVCRDSVVPNDFQTLFAACPGIARIVFNGRLAEQTWLKHVLPRLSDAAAALERIRVPSTSPAHAAMSFEQKLAAWRAALSDPGVGRAGARDREPARPDSVP